LNVDVPESMNQSVLYGVVLLSAIGHASWNALLKRTPDRLVMMVAIRIVGLLYGFMLLWYAGIPSIESLKWLIAAAVAMWVYQALLVQGYNFGDLSFVYPLARGVAPVVLTALAFLLIKQSVSLSQLLGVISISVGIVTLATFRRKIREPDSGGRIGAVVIFCKSERFRVDGGARR
jgi:drug/metabolite transporter (DMT)-like permease